jgi:hypothetical protein
MKQWAMNNLQRNNPEEGNRSNNALRSRKAGRRYGRIEWVQETEWRKE